MEGTDKISVSQLLLLLLLSRGFSLVFWSPVGGRERAALPAILLSGLLQAAVLGLGLFFCRGKTGDSPFLSAESGLYRVQNLLYWGCCVFAAVCTAVDFVSFMTTVVYDYREGWLVAATFAMAGAFAACQGLEGLARGGGILAVLLGVGCFFIALGLWREYDWRNLAAAGLSLDDALGGALRDAAGSWELFALPLLLPYLRKSPGTASWAGWVAFLTLAAVAVRLMTLLTLGAYGERKPFPVFTAVTAVGFSSFQRLDSVFLAIWVTLGLVRLTVFLSLAARCSANAFFRPWGSGWVWGNAALGLAGALALWSGPESWADALCRRWVTGAVTLAGALLLPMMGWLVDRRGERR